MIPDEGGKNKFSGPEIHGRFFIGAPSASITDSDGYLVKGPNGHDWVPLGMTSGTTKKERNAGLLISACRYGLFRQQAADSPGARCQV